MITSVDIGHKMNKYIWWTDVAFHNTEGFKLY